MARGRKRKGGERYPSGGLKPAGSAGDALPYTPEQVRHRALALGLDPRRLANARAGLERICMDASAGTALGRLTWIHRGDGSVARRMGDFGGGKAEAWISDEMAAAAEDYRELWVRWHRLERLPRRHAQAQSFERRNRVYDDTLDPDDPDHLREVRAAAARLRGCEQAITQCPDGPLARTLVENVVIENMIPAALGDELVRGGAGTALVALRTGLTALHRVLHGKRRERRAA